MPVNPLNGVSALLEMLNVPRERLLYVQASADWIQRAGFGAAETLAALREWIGGRGTLVMPSYPFHSTHLEYLESGAVFDVRKTPAGIGLLAEMFRRTPGAVRSLDPDFCVTAFGAEAEVVAGGEPSAPDPFGPGSSYQRMLDRHATLVGLGVSLNTNSFMHVIDSRAQAGYPSPVYVDRTFAMTVIDGNGRSRAVARWALRPQFQQDTASFGDQRRDETVRRGRSPRSRSTTPAFSVGTSTSGRRGASTTPARARPPARGHAG